MLQIDHLPGRTVWIDGKEYTYFSGTSYLGMAKNQQFNDYLQEGIQRYGTNYSSSRISNLQLSVYDETEKYLASLSQAGAALVVSSGYLAGQLVVRLLQDKGKFIYAPRTHPAVWLTPSNFFNHAFSDWTKTIVDRINAMPESDIIIVSNSLDPLLTQRYDFEWISRLPSHKNITLLIDDSHGFGVIGQGGAGIFSELRHFMHVKLIVVSSFGKAFGIPGGVVLSDQSTIEFLKKSYFFGASSPPIPAYLFAFLRSEKIYQEAREKLFANIAAFHGWLQGLTLFQTIPQYPVFYTPVNALYPYLQERQMLISSFPYPSPADDLITRVIISSLHTPDDIANIAHAIHTFANSQTGLPLLS